MHFVRLRNTENFNRLDCLKFSLFHITPTTTREESLKPHTTMEAESGFDRQIAEELDA